MSTKRSMMLLSTHLRLWREQSLNWLRPMLNTCMPYLDQCMLLSLSFACCLRSKFSSWSMTPTLASSTAWWIWRIGLIPPQEPILTGNPGKTHSQTSNLKTLLSFLYPKLWLCLNQVMPLMVTLAHLLLVQQLPQHTSSMWTRETLPRISVTTSNSFIEDKKGRILINNWEFHWINTLFNYCLTVINFCWP